MLCSGDAPIVLPPAGEMTQDLMEQFDSRWLGTGEYDPAMAPEGLESYPRAAEMYPRGQSPFPPSSRPYPPCQINMLPSAECAVCKEWCRVVACTGLKGSSLWRGAAGV